MNSIRIGDSPMSLVVSMGCTWDDVHSYLALHAPGLIAVGGTCLTVGVAGFILGGGYSFLSRSYGLGTDNVTNLTLVTADSRVRIVSSQSVDSEERELFWACLGGGGGIAVVTVLFLGARGAGVLVNVVLGPRPRRR